MSDFLVKHVPVLRDLSPKDAPSVSLHVLAKNAEGVLGRLIDHVAPYVREMRFVLNDTDDKSYDMIVSRLDAMSEVVGDVQEVRSTTHPEFYFEDTRASYEVGRPLSTEVFEGPFTEEPLLADWAGVRNLGWGSNSDWRLFLDADDLVDDPHVLPGLVRVLQDAGADLAASRYTFGRSADGKANSMAFRERLAFNTEDIKWVGKTHESLLGGKRHVLVDDCLSVTDMRDNQGRGLRVPGRCFKVLYREARVLDWKVPPRHLAYLVQECPGMLSLDWVTSDLLPAYLQVATTKEEVAWVHSMVGEQWEVLGKLGAAGLHYTRALSAYPSSKTAWRLCRVFFRLRDWKNCVAAYEQGVANLATPQLLDLGPVYEHASKILVAQAHHELGNKDLARKFIGEVRRAFPESRPVALLYESICGEDLGDG